MDKLDKVIKALSICSETGFCEGNNGCPYWKESDWHFDDCKQMAKDALELLKEQKQIKSPDEFKSILLGMFDSIWDVEIDHPVFQDTVGELMEGVMQAYRLAVKWE